MKVLVITATEKLYEDFLKEFGVSKDIYVYWSRLEQIKGMRGSGYYLYEAYHLNPFYAEFGKSLLEANGLFKVTVSKELQQEVQQNDRD